jgi:hypothetical protein
MCFIEPQSRAEPGYGKPHRLHLHGRCFSRRDRFIDPLVDLKEKQKEKKKKKKKDIPHGARTW